jgi:hypothetical protein
LQHRDRGAAFQVDVGADHDLRAAVLEAAGQ